MRARHKHHSQLRGEKSEHRARGGGVRCLPTPIEGEGTAPKLHGAKRARGGSCSDMERKRGGGIHIKKSHQGLLHKNLGVAKGQKIPPKKLSKALHSDNPKVKKRAVFAENAKHWHH